MKTNFFVTLGVIFMLFGCSGVDPKTYDGKEPKVTMKGFFDRNIEGYGYFTGRSGEIQTRYYIQMEPTWESNNKLTIKEHFYQDDGKEMRRQWNITMNDETHFTATAADVEGEGKGELHGYAINMKYMLKVPRESGSTITVDVDDFIFLQPDGTALNQAKMKKFGFHAGDLHFELHKLREGEKFKESFYLK